MEHDKHLKEIMEKGAEKASADFTGLVMANIHALALKPFVYKPLVSPRAKRICIGIFIVVLALIILTCLSIATSGMPSAWSVNMPEISPETYQKIISGILVFWTVFAINKLVPKAGGAVT